MCGWLWQVFGWWVQMVYRWVLWLRYKQLLLVMWVRVKILCLWLKCLIMLFFFSCLVICLVGFLCLNLLISCMWIRLLMCIFIGSVQQVVLYLLYRFLWYFIQVFRWLGLVVVSGIFFIGGWVWGKWVCNDSGCVFVVFVWVMSVSVVGFFVILVGFVCLVFSVWCWCVGICC